jgi:Tc toxin complex TcA C-terminal TcB-binding domain
VLPTIPCVTGPYTNVSATLTMTGSQMRLEPKLGTASLKEIPRRRTVAIATSSAQNDTGVFEFSFRDERYMPFEGGGAVSSWQLSLPRTFKPFDYHTISDVILHVSYTAEQEDKLRQDVEKEKAALEGSILKALSDGDKPLGRVFSLRQEFSEAFNLLLHSAPGTPVKIQITDKYFPLLLRGQNLQVKEALLSLVPAEKQTVDGVKLTVRGFEQAEFKPEGKMGLLPSKNLDKVFAAGLLCEHTLTVENGGDLAASPPKPGDASPIDHEKLCDILLYVEYYLVECVMQNADYPKPCGRV